MSTTGARWVLGFGFAGRRYEHWARLEYDKSQSLNPKGSCAIWHNYWAAIFDLCFIGLRVWGRAYGDALLFRLALIQLFFQAINQRVSFGQRHLLQSDVADVPIFLVDH